MLKKICREKHNTHFSENRTVYEMMWKSMVEQGRPQMTSWIPKITDTHSEYVILIAYLLQQWLDERASILCYTYITRLVWILLLLLQHFLQVPYSRHKVQ